ncbi:hypothetical protein S40288_01029 [Stachybotrys chartarum IBT 40288]|nr:hypothetical protein S40288_01029 [Stachybotrys chartarum IBT 40288]
MTELTRSDHQLVLPSLVAGNQDDWSGMSTHKRKKIQNRTNQRSRRELTSHFPLDAWCTNNLPTGLRQRQERWATLLSTSAAADALAGPNLPPLSTLVSAIVNHQVDLKTLIDKLNILQPRSQSNQVIVHIFQTIANQDKIAGIVRPTMLSSLTQFNITRALMLNAEVLGLSAGHLHDDALSPFVVHGPWPLTMNLDAQSLPGGLQPTSFQYNIKHHPWIDLLPIPQLRDNLLQRPLDSYDEDELCRAFTGRGHRRGNGVVVWCEPWDPSGWEITEEFVQSWGWVIAGCSDLFRSTDLWRARRGERPLFRSC